MNLDCKILGDDVKDDTGMAEQATANSCGVDHNEIDYETAKAQKPPRGIVEAMPQRLHSIYGGSWRDVRALEEPNRSRTVDTLRG